MFTVYSCVKFSSFQGLYGSILFYGTENKAENKQTNKNNNNNLNNKYVKIISLQKRKKKLCTILLHYTISVQIMMPLLHIPYVQVSVLNSLIQRIRYIVTANAYQGVFYTGKYSQLAINGQKE